MGRALQPLRDVSIPNNVRELCNRCFYKCESLCRVNFGSSSSFDEIRTMYFARCGLIEFEIPATVGSTGGAFGDCQLPGGFICRDGCQGSVFCRLFVFPAVFLGCVIVASDGA